jgi:hypothetical protein
VIAARDIVTLTDRVHDENRPVGFVRSIHPQIAYAYVSWVGATIFGDRLEAVPLRYLTVTRRAGAK